MTKVSWRSLRSLLLAATFLGAVAVAGKAVLAPNPAPPSEVATGSNDLPSNVPLENWQLVANTPLQAIPDLPPGQTWEYRQGETKLEVQARIMPGDGNISRFLFVYTPIRAANARLIIKQKTKVGFYGILTHEGRAYLSACVNPRGSSTVTEQQFMQYRYLYDLQAGRILPWLLGQQPLLDQRCLWTLMSMPLPANGTTDPAAVEQAFETLELAWVSWYKWWQAHFPPA